MNEMMGLGVECWRGGDANHTYFGSDTHWVEVVADSNAVFVASVGKVAEDVALAVFPGTRRDRVVGVRRGPERKSTFMLWAGSQINRALFECDDSSSSAIFSYCHCSLAQSGGDQRVSPCSQSRNTSITIPQSSTQVSNQATGRDKQCHIRGNVNGEVW